VKTSPVRGREVIRKETKSTS